MICTPRCPSYVCARAPRLKLACLHDSLQPEEGSSAAVWNVMEDKPGPVQAEGAKNVLSAVLPGTPRDLFETLFADTSHLFEDFLESQGNRCVFVNASRVQLECCMLLSYSLVPLRPMTSHATNTCAGASTSSLGLARSSWDMCATSSLWHLSRARLGTGACRTPSATKATGLPDSRYRRRVKHCMAAALTLDGHCSSACI